MKTGIKWWFIAVVITIVAIACGEGGSSGIDKEAAVGDAGIKGVTDSGPGDSGLSCGDAGITRESPQVADAVKQEVPCFTGFISFHEGTAPSARQSASSGSRDWFLSPCYDDGPQLKEMVTSAQQVAVLQNAPCLERQRLHEVYVIGGAGNDADALFEAIQATMGACSYPSVAVSRIVLDAGGKVHEVVLDSNEPDQSAELLQALECWTEALQGLSFPCLAGTDMCLLMNL